MYQQHPKISARIEAIEDETTQRVTAFATLGRWVAERNLHRLVDLAHHLNIATDTIRTMNDDGEWHNVPAGRWWASFTLPIEHKAELRPILLATFDTFDKNYFVDNYSGNGPLLVERWTHQWARIENAHRYHAHNQISIDFTSPVSAGQRLSDTCSVELITETSQSYDRLTVTCRKSES